jgi:very-short-patch-repair endonuclease
VNGTSPCQTVAKEKLQRARELRHDMTPAEKILWQELRGNKLGVHFRMQQVIAGFIVDFTVTGRGWLLNLMETSMIYSRKKMRDGKRF